MKTGCSISIASLMTAGMIITSFAGTAGNIFNASSGFYAGIGANLNTIDEQYSSKIHTSATTMGLDNYETNQNRLSPTIQIGYWQPFLNQWLWGISAQWEYLHYKTENVNTTHGQYLPNASFSSINIFGPNVLRDFSSQTQTDHVVNLLFYAGEQVKNGYLYIGLGPTLFTASNKIFVSSVHEGGGDRLFSNFANSNNTLWGGAIQAGYSYYINPSYFLNFSYTYSQSGTSQLNNAENTAVFNGSASPGPVTVNLNRKINIADQHLMITINRVLG